MATKSYSFGTWVTTLIAYFDLMTVNRGLLNQNKKAFTLTCSILIK